MSDIYFDVQGIGRVKLIQECGASLIVEDESGTRLSLPASRCTVSDQTAAALADQFSGEDMGAEMAAAEGRVPAFVAPSLAAVDAALAEIDALAEGYRVGDPHATDARDPATGEG